MFWDIVKNSTYHIETIDGISTKNRSFTRIKIIRKLESDIRRFGLSRRILQVPKYLLKHHYVKAIIFLRGMMKLQYFVLRKKYNLINENCSICMSKLSVPIFRHDNIGYHNICILDWIKIGLNLTDPCTRKPYNDKELKRLNQISILYGIRSQTDITLLEQKNDGFFEGSRAIVRELDDRVALIEDSIRTNIGRIRGTYSFSALEGMINLLFRQLAIIRIDDARYIIEDLIDRSDFSTLPQLFSFLLNLRIKIEEWNVENDDVESVSDELYNDFEEEFYDFIDINSFRNPGSLVSLVQNLIVENNSTTSFSF